jgi:hypothetical protein
VRYISSQVLDNWLSYQYAMGNIWEQLNEWITFFSITHILSRLTGYKILSMKEIVVGMS